MTENLSAKTCTPCRGGVPPMTLAEAQRYLRDTPKWELRDDGHRIERTFKFGDFQKALDFVVKVGAIAEQDGHHPDIHFGWGYATVSLNTHKIKGLHENDFIVASKINKLPGAA